MGSLSVQSEPIHTLWPELLPLAAAHWDEVNPGSGHAEIDCKRYEHAEKVGTYAILTLRHVISEMESDLIGYSSFWISTNPQQKRTKQATQDALYLVPEYRQGRIGRMLLVHSERFLRDQGVTIVMQSVRRAPNFGPLLIATGYEPIETTYEKRL